MKTKFVIIAITMFVVVDAFAGGKAIESLELNSKILSYGVKYSVYLPDDYDISNRSYPVIYLLHGYTDDETSWIQFGEIDRIMDEGIRSGEYSPSIIIMPDAKLSWYCNNLENRDFWRDMFINEFIPTIEKKFRIKSKKEFRAIVGISMGGFGALSIALNYPDIFSACVPLSAALFTDEEIINMSEVDYSRFQNFCGKDIKGKNRINLKWKEINPFNLIEKIPVQKANSIRFYFDCGDKDNLIKGNMFMHLKMQELKIGHEFRVRNGTHGWIYWRSSMPEVLKFISNDFHR